ncbi:MAG: ATPase, T2SS/T4P/T4SS family, partial [Candidatus Methanomethylophilaceae archaeon]
NRIHVTMNGISGINSNLRCRTNLMVDRKEIMNLINVLKRDSGLQFCESEPVLETDMKGRDARATVIGYPMSPNGDAVSIRKHSTRPWTLTRLIANGTLDHETAGLLSFLVDNRCTFLVCGARGAGKSSMLTALMFEFPISQRILTIEDTLELPGDKMRKMGYKVQSMLINDRIEGDSLSRADEALRVSLRMGDSAIVLGEVRGEEAKTMYQSMRAGRAGSSVMGTIHGDSARSVYERVVHDMGIAPEAFMATDVLITLGSARDRRSGDQKRALGEIVATGGRPGEFIDISDAEGLFSSPAMIRISSSCGMGRNDILNEIRSRSGMRKMLAEAGSRDEKFLWPEWINMANDHLSRNSGKNPKALISSFEAKVRRAEGAERIEG